MSVQTKKCPCSNSKKKAAEAAPRAKKHAAPKAKSGKRKAADVDTKAKKHAAPKAKSGKRKAADAALNTNESWSPNTHENWLSRYPGQPSKAVLPVHVKDFSLYTDMKMRAWRLKRHGERRDKACSFRKDPMGAWNKLWKVIRAG